MIGFRSLGPLLVSVLLLPPPAPAEAERRFRMYRNPPKPKLVVLKAESRLEKSAKDLFDQALAKEARRLEGYRVVGLPEGMPLDSLGQLPPGGLSLLREKHGVDLVLESVLEAGPDRSVLFAEIVDTRTGRVRADFRQECTCPLAEVIAKMVPEGLKLLSGSPRLRGMRCGEEMALIPSPDSAGSPGPDSANQGWGKGAFCMDLYEYPNRPAGEPVVEKTWDQAVALCAGEGKRLCTEAEWELACGGWKAQPYPYGEGYQAGRCNTQSQTIQLSGGNGGCRSPFGVYDLSGNVYEWTASKWSSKYRDQVVKGGNWNAGGENSSCQARFGQPAPSVSKAIGFRCCLTLDR